MSNRLTPVSMTGRMAYIVMCIEKYLIIKYPDRDWRTLSKVLWKSTSMNWGDWAELYSNYIPDVILQYDAYDSDEFADYIDENTFSFIKALYSGITSGNENDPTDIVNTLLNLPHEMAMVYEGTTIGDGQESLSIIEHAEAILLSQDIELPDYTKVLFSKSSERNGDSVLLYKSRFPAAYIIILTYPFEAISTRLPPHEDKKAAFA